MENKYCNKLNKFIGTFDEVSDEHLEIYYSAWYYSAVHVMLSMKGFRTHEAIEAYFDLSSSRVNEILQFLVGAGLAEKAGKEFHQKKPVLHLDRDSKYISRHHSNWRFKVIAELQNTYADAFHYSGIAAISKKDYQVIVNIFEKTLMDTVNVVKNSGEEKCVALCLDLFWLG